MVRFSAFRGTFFQRTERESPPVMAMWEERQRLKNGSFFAAKGNPSGREAERKMGKEKTAAARGQGEDVPEHFAEAKECTGETRIEHLPWTSSESVQGAEAFLAMLEQSVTIAGEKVVCFAYSLFRGRSGNRTGHEFRTLGRGESSCRNVEAR